jgi:hypothetical protein
MLDENQASYVPGDMAPRSYHCPNTACDGHFYLKQHELGQQQTCPKCGLRVTVGWRREAPVGGTVRATGGDFQLGARIVRAAQRPEFRIAILACVIWLLLVRIYQPWERQYYQPWNVTRYKASIVENAAFFFWRIGFETAGNNPLAVVVGLTVITALVYIVGWVIRGFTRIGGGPPQSPATWRTGTARGPANLQPADDAGGQDAGPGMVRFVKLCDSIRLNCWQQIQEDETSRDTNNEILKRAYGGTSVKSSPGFRR